MLIPRNVAVAIRRSLFRLWSQRLVVDIKRLKYIISNLFYQQTHCTSVGIDTNGRQTNSLHDRIDTKVRQGDLGQQARHLLVIFENVQVEATLKAETTFSNLNCS